MQCTIVTDRDNWLSLYHALHIAPEVNKQVKSVSNESAFVNEWSLWVTGHPDQLSLAMPSWVGAMSTSQR